MGDFVALTITGLLTGAVYALVALGLNLIFGVMRILNFAHGAVLALGMYLTFFFYSDLGVHPYLAALPVVAILFLLGVLIQRYLLTRVMGAPEASQLLLTLGILIIIENLLLMVWGPTPRFVSTGIDKDTVQIITLRTPLVRLVAFGVALLANGVIFAGLRWTSLGKAIRATAQDPVGARLVGININRTYEITFGLSLAAAGLAGAFVAPSFYIVPNVGEVFLLIAFVAVVVGGLGNIFGAAFAGLLIGVVESLGSFYLPGSWGLVIVFSMLFVVLVVRPQGLFGSAERIG